jgi:hypothetical protein
MNPSRHSRVCFLVLVPFAVLAAACSDGDSARADDDASGIESAVVAGGARTSPLENGIYDSSEHTLYILDATEPARSQAIVLAGDGGRLLCEGRIDVNVGSGALTIVPAKEHEHAPAVDGCRGRLRNIMAGTALDLLDVVRGSGSGNGSGNGSDDVVPTGRFERRRGDALAGTYRSGADELTIRTSSDTGVLGSLKLGEKSTPQSITFNREMLSRYSADEGGTLTVTRDRGRFVFELATSSRATTTVFR